MKKILFFVLILISFKGFSQSTVLLRGDTIKVYKQGDTATLKVEGEVMITHYKLGSANDSILRWDPVTKKVRMSDASGIGGVNRFGVSGEDAIATQNRTFTGNDNTYYLRFDSLASWRVGRDGVVRFNMSSTTSSMISQNTSAAFTAGPSTAVMNFGSNALTALADSTQSSRIIAYIDGFKNGMLTDYALTPRNYVDSLIAGAGSNLIFEESVVESNDSVFLRGEKIYTPATNTFYGRDNANNPGYHSAAIINLTNVENKHFLNYKNGEWLNTKYFQEMKFIVGEDVGYPDAGDSTFIDTAFAYRKINVFREGDLQYQDDPLYGWEIDDATSKIIFHPPLFEGERVILQIYDTLQWNSITHTIVEECVDFNLTGDLTESPACTWSSAAGTGKGYGTKSLQIGDDGYYIVSIVNSDNYQAPIGLDDDASNVEAYVNWECTVYANTGTYRYHENGGAAQNSGVAYADGDLLRFYVASGVIKAQKSSNGGGLWTDIYTFTGVTQDHILYPKVDLAVAGKKITDAKIFGFQ